MQGQSHGAQGGLRGEAGSQNWKDRVGEGGLNGPGIGGDLGRTESNAIEHRVTAVTASGDVYAHWSGPPVRIIKVQARIPKPELR